MTEARSGGDAPDVTVIIPVYNTHDYLRRTLDSLLDQTLDRDRIQVVAVDDGSTDGSGAVLDEYAAAHPKTFVVVHQANSGGPASPGNVGLEHARGRYVFFLGSDDHLGPEALERMVARADEWDSDVVCVKLVPTDGREIAQALFTRTEPELAFPDHRPFFAANTKLFRRSVLTEHRIRYDERLLIACDQPFTLEAMYRSRRISVLSDYDYYFAVLRDDDSNITYQPDVLGRLDAFALVMDDIAGFLPPGRVRDEVLVRQFRWDFGNRLAELAEMPSEIAAGVVERTARAARSYLTPYLDSLLPVPARLRVRWARDGAVDRILALNAYDDSGSAPLVRVDDTGVARLDYPRAVVDPDRDPSLDRDAMRATGPFATARTLIGAHEGGITVDDVELGRQRLVVRGTVRLDPAAADRFGGRLREAGRSDEDDDLAAEQVEVAPGPDGGSSFVLGFDLSDLARTATVGDRWVLRFSLDLADATTSAGLPGIPGFRSRHVRMTDGRRLRVRTGGAGRLQLVCRAPRDQAARTGQPEA